MSPQSRATAEYTRTTTALNDGCCSGNVCPGASSNVAVLTMAANMEYALHKIDSESGSSSDATPVNPLLLHQATSAIANDASSQLLRKRSAARITPKNQPFLSSYGSAFLSGIFADIAHQETSGEPTSDVAATIAHTNVTITANTADDNMDECNEPHPKKLRTTASTSLGRQPKSYMALAGLAEGAGVPNEVSSPSVVSPRPNVSTLKCIETKSMNLNDQVRELQDMAFPSLPNIPMTVSSSSFSSSSQQAGVSPRGEEQDGPSYGWFVSTDDDAADASQESAPSSSMFLPDAKPDLAFRAITAPNAGDQELEVQQALAADTIDDVLGDLF